MKCYEKEELLQALREGASIRAYDLDRFAYACYYLIKHGETVGYVTPELFLSLCDEDAIFLCGCGETSASPRDCWEEFAFKYWSEADELAAKEWWKPEGGR